MIDIKLIRENRDLVKENIKKKFQDEKLPIVDEVYNLDEEYRLAKFKADNLRSEKNKVSASIGEYVKNKETDKIEEAKKRVQEISREIEECGNREVELEKLIREKMMVIPNIIKLTRKTNAFDFTLLLINQQNTFRTGEYHESKNSNLRTFPKRHGNAKHRSVHSMGPFNSPVYRKGLVPK